MARIQQQHVASLTEDLWAKVFWHLEEMLEAEYQPEDSQASMHRLNLVCKQFRQAFVSHAGVVRQRILLSHSFSHKLLPSLLAWLDKKQSSVRALVSRRQGPIVAVVLAQLQSPQPTINLVEVYGVSPALLTAFSNLERCELRNNKGSDMNLEPLGGLPRLHHLGLRGQFKNLHHVTGLTRLECASNFPVSDGIISNVQEFATTLQHLNLDRCVLLGVHALGLSACTALTQLVLISSSLTLDNGDIYFDPELSLSPSNLGLLGQLHTLHVSSSEEEISSLSWISTLTSLRHLTVHIRSCNNSPARSASCLTNLTHLKIYATSRLSDDEDPVLNIDAPWDRLQALQILSICDFRLQLGAGLGVGGLLQLPHLREMSLHGSTVGESDSECFAALMYNFARLLPQVQVACSSGNLTGFFERLPVC
ncbi:hypothetical protein ABBQ38_012293 [Trebouxia sp. C0009 RCD-2024]